MPRAAKLPGRSGFFKKIIFCQSFAPGSEVARDKWLLQEKVNFLRKVLPKAAKLPGTSGFFNKNVDFWKEFCPRQRSCPGQVVSSKNRFLEKSAPGSEAARDKLPLQKNNFLPKVLPQAAKLPGTSGFFKRKGRISGKCSAPGSEATWDKWLLPKKVKFLEKVLPKAAKLPGTSCYFPKKSNFWKNAPGSEAARDKWLFPNTVKFLKKLCPMQRSYPGQVVSPPNSHFWRKK